MFGCIDAKWWMYLLSKPLTATNLTRKLTFSFHFCTFWNFFIATSLKRQNNQNFVNCEMKRKTIWGKTQASFSVWSHFSRIILRQKWEKEPCRSVLLVWVVFEPDHPKQFTICQITSILPYLKNVAFFKKRESERKKERRKEKLNVFQKKKSLIQFQQAKLSPATSNTQVRVRQT